MLAPAADNQDATKAHLRRSYDGLNLGFVLTLDKRSPDTPVSCSRKRLRKGGSGPSRPLQLLSVSARSKPALEEATRNLVEHFHNPVDTGLADAAYTLHVGRRAFDFRHVAVCTDGRDAGQRLGSSGDTKVFTGRRPEVTPSVVFMFPGQGSQYPGMAEELYGTEPLFRSEVDRCTEVLRPILGRDLRTVLFPSPEDEAKAAEELGQTRFTQPALLVVEYALARLWMSWGIQPSAMVGHSVGEYTAACVAGVLTIEDALALVAERAALVQAQPSGSMLSVRLPEEDLAPLVEAPLAIAAVNSPRLCVVSGPEDAIATLERQLGSQGTVTRGLHTSHAFHSPMMEPVVAPFLDRLRRIRFSDPRIPVVSNVTGDWITPDQARSPEYWADHVRRTVRFADSLATLLDGPPCVCLELGPGRTLCQMVHQHPAKNVRTVALASLGARREAVGDTEVMLEALSRAWVNGIDVNWWAFYEYEDRRRVPLPTYPFERKRFWVDPPQVASPAPVSPGELEPLHDTDGPTECAEPSKSSQPAQIALELRGILERLSDLPSAELDRPVTFLELGFDSLFLAEFSREVEMAFGVPVAFGQLVDSKLADLAKYLDDRLRPNADTGPTPDSPKPAREVGEASSSKIALPLTAGQREIWLASKLGDNASRAYNEVLVLHLRGDLQVEILQAAIQELVDRHDSLRIAVSANGEQQFIHPERKQNLLHLDLSNVPAPEQSARLRELTDGYRHTVFDLVGGPLMKVHLTRLSQDHHVLHLAFHHIAIDGWSTHLLVTDLGQSYSARTGTNSARRARPMQYRDYVKWYYDAETARGRADDEAHWLRSFADLPASVELPTKNQRPARRSYRAGSAATAIEGELYRRIKKASMESGSTLFHFLLSTFGVWLGRITGQPDIVVGVPIAGQLAPGRHRVPGAECLVGHCASVMPIRMDVQGGSRFVDFMARVKQKMVEARTHGSFTYGELVEKLRPPRDPSRVPFVSVTLNLNDEPTVRWDGLSVEAEVPPLGCVFFDLEIDMWESPNGLRVSCYFAEDLFDTEVVEEWLSQWKTLMASASSTPARRLDRLELIEREERDRLLVAWNWTEVECPDLACVHERFEAQAARTPDAVAVVAEGGTLSYASLNKSANQLAHYLRRQGIWPGALVGVYLDRTPSMVTALLAVLKCGAAYIPLDPIYPPDRIAFMLQDANTAVVLTQDHLRSTRGPLATQVVCLDRDRAAIAQEPVENLSAGIDASALAYVIYTSGSTGQPKGVQVEHRALANFLAAMHANPGLTAADRLLAVTTLSFDIAALELFLPLTQGARLILASRSTAVDGRALQQALVQHDITVMQATPATWRLLVEAGWTGSAGLKVLCGGEPLPPDLARQLLPRCAELWNMYGPTETTIWSSCGRVTDASAVHIGRPIQNTEVYVLDAQRQPVPSGVPGELFIGGAGLARGYLHRPELTAEKFITHPFRSGARLYRTGDLARYRSDGTLECLGRLDSQVKIRGFRVELGEVEHALSGHPRVREAVVMAREDTPGDKRLIAYLVPQGPNGLDEHRLRDHLRAHLPDYMLPSAFVILDQVPRMPNGKVDRKALQRLPISTEEAGEPIPPRSETEQRLARLFSSVLKIEPVGVNQSFFDLGGHSLLAARLMMRIEKEFGQHLPLAVLFSTPTVHGLAERLVESGSAEAWDNLVPISVTAHAPRLFLVHGAGGNVLLFRDLAQYLAPHISTYGFQSQGLDRVSRRLESVEEMASQYVNELRRFQPSDPYHLGGYCLGGAVAYEMARLLRLQGAEVGLVAMLDTYNLDLVRSQVTLPFRLSVWREWLLFQLDNLRRVGPRKRAIYLAEKARMAGEVAGGSLNAHIRHLCVRFNWSDADPGAIEHIQKLNDRAAWAFTPQPALGPVALFKPETNYSFMSDPQMGWGDVVPGLEVVELPLNPHAMLIPPFVETLGQEPLSRLVTSSMRSAA